MVTLATSCQNCAYKEMHGTVQTGCQLKMLSKFEECGYEVNNIVIGDNLYKRVETLCMFRSNEKLPVEDIRQKIYPKVNFVVIHPKGRTDEQLKTTLNSINNVRFRKVIVVTEETSFAPFVRKCKEIIDNCEIVLMIEKLYKDHMYDEAFKRCVNGYVAFVDSGKEVPVDMVDRLDSAMHDDLKKVYYISGEIPVYMAAIYKHVKGYKNGPISEQLKDLEGYTWSNLNE
jgi:hypothetical protein